MSKRGKAITIREASRPAMTITRAALRAEKVVYLICAERPQKYEIGRSRILYIGTTRRGARRYSASLSNKAIECLEYRGVKELKVHVVTCKPRQGMDWWTTLERDLLMAFKAMHGSVPKRNTSGKNRNPDALSGFFRPQRLATLLRQYE